MARRYPLLFASTGADEDVLMAAARLVDSEPDKGFSEDNLGARRQAEAFLQEAGESEEIVAAVLRLASATYTPKGILS